MQQQLEIFKNIRKHSKISIDFAKCLKSSEHFREPSNVSECIPTHPDIMKRIGTRPSTSNNFKKIHKRHFKKLSNLRNLYACAVVDSPLLLIFRCATFAGLQVATHAWKANYTLINDIVLLICLFIRSTMSLGAHNFVWPHK